MKSTIKLAALAPALLLGGCLSFGGEAPDSLLTLTPTAMVPAGAGAPMSQSNAIALVELEEGTRIVSNVVGIAAAEIRIGMPVQVEFLEIDENWRIPQFRPTQSDH